VKPRRCRWLNFDLERGYVLARWGTEHRPELVAELVRALEPDAEGGLGGV
jgi:hypothetical protein